jgi:hypothetical protein
VLLSATGIAVHRLLQEDHPLYDCFNCFQHTCMPLDRHTSLPTYLWTFGDTEAGHTQGTKMCWSERILSRSRNDRYVTIFARCGHHELAGASSANNQSRRHNPKWTSLILYRHMQMYYQRSTPLQSLSLPSVKFSCRKTNGLVSRRCSSSHRGS